MIPKPTRLSSCHSFLQPTNNNNNFRNVMEVPLDTGMGGDEENRQGVSNSNQILGPVDSNNNEDRIPSQVILASQRHSPKRGRDLYSFDRYV